MIYLFILKEDYEDTETGLKFSKGDGLTMSSSQKKSSVVTCELNKQILYVPLSKGAIYKKNEISTCHKCEKYITSEYVKVIIGKSTDDKENGTENETILHKECYNCENCNDSLLNKKATVKNKQIFCPECTKPTVEQMKKDIKKNIEKITRLSINKKEPEKKGEEIKNEDKSDSDLPPPLHIETAENVLYDDDDSDSDDVHCVGCKKTIDEKTAVGYIRAMNKNWHSECFKCFRCMKVFKDAMFYNYEGNPCCLEDYKKIITDKLPKCTNCNSPISGNCISYNENKFHIDCFVCCVDNKPIKRDDDGFYNKDSKIYCNLHYKEKFLSKCEVCEKYIDSAFIEVGGNKYHKVCFKCEECKNDLVVIGLSGLSKKLKKLICVKCAKQIPQ